MIPLAPRDFQLNQQKTEKGTLNDDYDDEKDK